MTQQDAVVFLAGFDGHDIMGPSAAKEIAKPFNIKAEVETFEMYGRKIKGVAAYLLAEAVADSLYLAYPSMFGKGSRFNVAVRELKRYFDID